MRSAVAIIGICENLMCVFSSFEVDPFTLKPNKEEKEEVGSSHLVVECCSAESRGDLCFRYNTPSWATGNDDGHLSAAERLLFSPPPRPNYRCINARKLVDNFECQDNR